MGSAAGPTSLLPGHHCPFRLLVFLWVNIPAGRYPASPSPGLTKPLAMASNDSTALAIPGQVLPFFYIKETIVKRGV